MAKVQVPNGALEVVNEITRRRCVLQGLNPIMFDRYGGDNKAKLDPAQKFYFMPDRRTLAIPASNLHSLLSAELTNSAPKMFEGKGWQVIAKACLSYVAVDPADTSVDPVMSPILRDGKPVTFGSFVDDKDAESGAFVFRNVARMKKGQLVIPNPKVRPVLPTPWSVEFIISIYKNDDVNEAKVLRLLKMGGLAIGLGTWRGVFGKFEVAEWEEV